MRVNWYDMLEYLESKKQEGVGEGERLSVWSSCCSSKSVEGLERSSGCKNSVCMLEEFFDQS